MFLASPEAGRGNCLPYVQRLSRFPANQENKCRNKMKINKRFKKLNTKPTYPQFI